MVVAKTEAVDLSRPRLKRIAKWIRDDLDLLIAREGPNVLHPDDVLTLHDTFVALQKATSITVLDLRATGIHRAVQDVAGVATRWPGRLCDDCDVIIALWTDKFGPFSELHPFLYGRGGRLEGIASVAEHTREALLKRWSLTCPEKLHPKRSHRLGDLGFRAGDWWINTLYAHHAGIIGLEAIEGGTTFDKHGAYAVVLKTTGEVEAREGEHFTYRVPHSDKGKFRLTSATPHSRDPIRVLRSHNISSIWGPKAGVRYEGLYGVTGWSIRLGKAKDSAMGDSKEGEIIFEVRFQRIEKVPIGEVEKRPTATEIDDYAEYKRLRKFQREGKRKSPHETSRVIPPEFLHATSEQPPLVSPQPAGIARMTSIPSDEGMAFSSRSMFKRLRYDLPERAPYIQPDVISPGTVTDRAQFFISPVKSSAPPISAMTKRLSHIQLDADPVSNAQNPRLDAQATSQSPSNSAQTGKGKAAASIRDIIPWIEYEPALTVPSETSLKRDEDTSQTSKEVSGGTDSKKSHNSSNKDKHDTPPLALARNRRKSGNLRGMTGFLSTGAKRGDGKKAPPRSANPMAKLFDGAASEGDEPSEASPPGVRKTSTHGCGRNASSSEAGVRVLSPQPMRVFGTAMERRGGMYSDVQEEVKRVTIPNVSEDPFIDAGPALPVPLKEVVAQPRTDSSLDVSAAMSCAQRDDTERLRLAMQGLDIKVNFENPFLSQPTRTTTRKASSEAVAPDFVG